MYVIIVIISQYKMLHIFQSEITHFEPVFAIFYQRLHMQHAEFIPILWYFSIRKITCKYCVNYFKM